jgi:hypothetical protein
MIGNDFSAELVGLAGELSRGIKIAKKTLGSLMDNIEVATPPWSISSIDCATVHFIKGTWPVLRPVISAMNPGDERWW